MSNSSAIENDVDRLGASPGVCACLPNGESSSAVLEAFLPTQTSTLEVDIAAVAEQLAPDRSQQLSTVQRWQLPTYRAPPPSVVEGLAMASSMQALPIAGADPNGLSFNTIFRPCLEMGEKDFFMIPLRAPEGQEAMDFGFLSQCGLGVFATKAKPTVGTTFCSFVGIYGIDPATTALDLRVEEAFRIESPAFFMAATADMLQLCQQMAGGVLGRKRFREGIDTDVDKRRRGLQEELGVQTATDADPPQGERGSTYVVDLEGRQHLTRVKTDLSSRETSLAVVFRATEKARWRYAMGTECILQVRDYREMIKEQYTTRHEDREVAFEGCGLLDRVVGLGFTWDNDLLEKLITGKVGTTEGFLGLNNFIEEGTRLPTEDAPDRGHNRMMVVALTNLELVLIIFLAPAFRGCTATLRECLEGVKRPLELAPAGYLLHEVEMVVTKFFRVLRTGSQAGEDLSNPTGCASYLASLFERFITQTASPSLLSESVNRYRLVMSRDGASRQKDNQGQRPRTKATTAASTLRTPPPQVKLEPPPLVRKQTVTGICAGHFGGQLRLVDPKVGKVYNCSRSPGECKFQHKDSTNMSRAAIVEVANTFSPSLRDGFLAALAAQKH